MQLMLLLWFSTFVVVVVFVVFIVVVVVILDNLHQHFGGIAIGEKVSYGKKIFPF